VARHGDRFIGARQAARADHTQHVVLALEQQDGAHHAHVRVEVRQPQRTNRLGGVQHAPVVQRGAERVRHLVDSARPFAGDAQALRLGLERAPGAAHRPTSGPQDDSQQAKRQQAHQPQTPIDPCRIGRIRQLEQRDQAERTGRQPGERGAGPAEAVRRREHRQRAQRQQRQQCAVEQPEECRGERAVEQQAGGAHQPLADPARYRQQAGQQVSARRHPERDEQVGRVGQAVIEQRGVARPDQQRGAGQKQPAQPEQGLVQTVGG